MTRVKICGIRSEEHALAAARAGADLIGLVFAPSPRQVTPAQAQKIVAALKKDNVRVEAVGVFVDTPADEVNRIALSCRLDRVQLSGDEDRDYCRKIDRPIIKAVRPGTPPGEEMARGARLLDNKEHVILLDTAVPGRYGGTGKTFDWRLALPIARRFPVIIAGGLTPENVAEAIWAVHPWGVDVSSGVETGGVKDMVKIEKFIKAVREADVVLA
jgi:phosphoribosylanthranilate isomerase